MGESGINTGPVVRRESLGARQPQSQDRQQGRLRHRPDRQFSLAIAAHPFLRDVSHCADGFTARMGAGAVVRRVPFDAVEVNDAFPGLVWANYRARRFNARHCRLPLVGNSDAHVKEAIGCSYTRFAGRSAQDLAAAIRSGQVAPGCRPYARAQIRAYFRFWRQQGHGRRE